MYTNYRFLHRSYGNSSPINSNPKIDHRKPWANSFAYPKSPYKKPQNESFSYMQDRTYSNIPSPEPLRIKRNNSRERLSLSPIDRTIENFSVKKRDLSPSFNGKSGRLKSLAFRKEIENEIGIPERISKLIIEIYSPNSLENEPTAIGLLIGSKIIITSHIAIPNETLAARYTFKFLKDENVYKSNIKKFFFTSPNDNLTVLAITPINQDLTKRVPLSFESNLKELEGDPIYYVNQKAYQAFISSIDADIFGFTTQKSILTGTPVFTKKWQLLGISHTFTQIYKYTQAASLETVLKFLNRLKSHIPRDSLLGSIEKSVDFNGKEFNQNNFKEMYWFEWLGNYIETYNVETGEWNYMQTSLRNEGRWHFLWDSRPVMLPNGSFYILGGMRNNLAVDEVVKFKPEKGELKRMQNMGVGRAACGTVFHEGFVYALSGKYANNFCERYSLSQKRWEFIPSMVHERFDFSAIVLFSSIYVVGGEPYSEVGNTIEVYDILREVWVILNIKLPFAVANSPLCHLFGSSFAILGGRGCRNVIMVEIDNLYSKSVSIREGAALSEEVETIYPVIYAAEQQKVFLFNITEGFERPLLYKIHESYLTK
ncbi:unnamed protein product [Blepharisma stoltei]|uniref:Kelch motif family protein n=1 Tax=Blepharisma stoltei TaxID=1481888 RepID=A0AAU9JM92_9CILI|nr:unnamed protein product [Blepharisma stoltei]